MADVVVGLLIVSLLAAGIGLWIRARAVLSYRLVLLDEIDRAASAYIDAQVRAREPRWLGWETFFDAFHAVSFQRMVLQFWRPLDSFYADPPWREWLDA